MTKQKLADLEKNSFENLRSKHLEKQHRHLRNRFIERIF